MKLVAILAAVLIVTGAAVALDGSDTDTRPPSIALGDVRLVSVDSCGELLEWYQESARAVDAGALGGFGSLMALEDGAVAVAGSAGAPSAARAGAEADQAASASPEASATTVLGVGGGEGGDGFSGTNLQEEDVDEPDTVKTNGDIIVQATSSGVHIVDITGDEPRLVGTVDLEDGGTELLLDGDRVLALTNAWRDRQGGAQPADGGDRIGIMPAYGEPVVVLSAIDISDPGNPEIVATSEVDGMYRSARVVGDTVRLVLTATPQLPQPGPAVYESGDPGEVERRLDEWKADTIAAMTLDDWMPSIDGERAVACESVAHPAQPAGFATTTVLTLDLHGELEHLDEDAVVADAGTIYASTNRLYVATSQWAATFAPERGGSPSTELHAFDITDSTSTSYVGSGSVPGFLLNQFSLSERGGYLRIATTQQEPWNQSQQEQATSSSMAVLAEEGDALVEVGRLDGLGPTETIQAVRYVDDVAYVVTFRRTDPLFVIDLADPTNPSVAGELKIPGYSAYLHPIEEGRMLGVGQDADAEGRALGTQVSTFDVRDAAAPTRIDNVTIERASSMVEYDHRAFLWWANTRTAVIPVEVYPEFSSAEIDCPPDAACASPAPGPEQRPFLGAVAFGVDGDGDVRELGRVSHDGRGAQPDGWYQVTRSIVAGDALYTISEAGVLKSDLSTFEDEGFAQLPAPVHEDGPMPVDVGGGTGGAEPASRGSR